MLLYRATIILLFQAALTSLEGAPALGLATCVVAIVVAPINHELDCHGFGVWLRAVATAGTAARRYLPAFNQVGGLTYFYTRAGLLIFCLSEINRMRATRRLLVYNEADLLLLLWRLIGGDCADSAGLGCVRGSVGQGVVARGGKRV